MTDDKLRTNAQGYDPESVLRFAMTNMIGSAESRTMGAAALLVAEAIDRLRDDISSRWDDISSRWDDISSR